MSGEGILDDPSIFFGHQEERLKLLKGRKTASKDSVEFKQLTRDLERLPLSAATKPATKPSRLHLALEYLDLAEMHPVKQRSAHSSHYMCLLFIYV